MKKAVSMVISKIFLDYYVIRLQTEDIKAKKGKILLFLTIN